MNWLPLVTAACTALMVCATVWKMMVNHFEHRLTQTEERLLVHFADLQRDVRELRAVVIGVLEHRPSNRR